MMSSMDQSSPWWPSATSFRGPIQPVELHVPFHRNGVKVRPYVAGKAPDDGARGGGDTAVERPLHLSWNTFSIRKRFLACSRRRLRNDTRLMFR
jgi:hypothetical protein